MIAYPRILAAVNEHLNSEIAARYALRLARVCESKFYVCFIAGKGLARPDFESAENAVKRLFVEANRENVPVESIVETGDPVRRLQEIVRQEQVSLVFASTRREDIQRRFYAGTVARALLLRLPCSVALVRVAHTGQIHPRRIFVPLKARMDHVHERAFFAARLAQAFHSNLFLFHVTRPISRLFHGEIHLSPHEWGKRLPGQVSEFMERIREQQVDFEERIAPGTVGRSITVEAASKRHDLIVMGASQRSLLSSLFQGNPVEEVLRETPCDLIILMPRHEDQ